MNKKYNKIENSLNKNLQLYNESEKEWQNDELYHTVSVKTQSCLIFMMIARERR